MVSSIEAVDDGCSSTANCVELVYVSVRFYRASTLEWFGFGLELTFYFSLTIFIWKATLLSIRLQ